MILVRTAATIVLIVLAAASARAADAIPGPIVAEVVRVYDGDTIDFRADIWPQLTVTSSVRLRGLDTPELRGECPEEKALAAVARERLAELAGDRIRLANIDLDKYGGRVVADVSADNGADLAAAMIASGLARPYDGGARGGWCFTGSVAVAK